VKLRKSGTLLANVF
jgi:hypothetical protein